MWEKNAKKIKEVYGGFVNWSERFYICPYCGEPIYDCDWSDEELEKYLCPVCEDVDEDIDELLNALTEWNDEAEAFINGEK